jgi:hypothetical protein
VSINLISVLYMEKRSSLSLRVKFTKQTDYPYTVKILNYYLLKACTKRVMIAVSCHCLTAHKANFKRHMMDSLSVNWKFYLLIKYVSPSEWSHNEWTQWLQVSYHIFNWYRHSFLRNTYWIIVVVIIMNSQQLSWFSKNMSHRPCTYSLFW